MEIFNNKTGLGFIQKDTTSFYALVQTILYYICKLKKDVIMLSWNLQKEVSQVSSGSETIFYVSFSVQNKLWLNT